MIKIISSQSLKKYNPIPTNFHKSVLNLLQDVIVKIIFIIYNIKERNIPVYIIIRIFLSMFSDLNILPHVNYSDNTCNK